MSIQVLNGYQGKPSGDQFIPAGIYAADDVALFGLAAYLVTNGHAVEIDAPAAEVPPAEDEADEEDTQPVRRGRR